MRLMTSSCVSLGCALPPQRSGAVMWLPLSSREEPLPGCSVARMHVFFLLIIALYCFFYWEIIVLFGKKKIDRCACSALLEGGRAWLWGARLCSPALLSPSFTSVSKSIASKNRYLHPTGCRIYCCAVLRISPLSLLQTNSLLKPG